MNSINTNRDREIYVYYVYRFQGTNEEKQSTIQFTEDLMPSPSNCVPHDQAKKFIQLLQFELYLMEI